MREQSFHSSTAPPPCLLLLWGDGLSKVTAAVSKLQSITQKEE